MCRQAVNGRPADNPDGNWCTALGLDPSKWDKDCLLRPKGAADPSQQVDLFVEALTDFCSDHTLSQQKLQVLEDAAQHAELKDWYIRHGNKSGNFRSSIPKSQLPKVPPNGSKELSDELLKQVLERDGYRCQYCGCRLIEREVWKSLETLSSSHGRHLIKKLNQRQGVTDEEVTGLIFATWPFADHVLAFSRGGCTNLDNLVASCFACNYGKDNFTCDELGIANPLSNPKAQIINSDGSAWSGLIEFIEQLDSF